jgi:hypothetical protein
MAEFKIGGRVLCVNDSKLPLSGSHCTSIKRGKVYMVNGLYQNKCCDLLVVDIGIKGSSSMKTCVCGNRYTADIDIWWLGAFRFIPLEDEEIGEKTIEQVLEEVETLEGIRSYLKEVRQ